MAELPALELESELWVAMVNTMVGGSVAVAAKNRILGILICSQAFVDNSV